MGQRLPGLRLPAIVQVAWWIRWPIPMLRHCVRRFGDVFTLRLPGFAPLVLFSDPAAVKEIMTADPDDLRAGAANVVLGPLVGANSLLLMDGARHRRERRLLMPAFHGERMHLYGDVMRRLADRAIEGWPTGRAFPVQPEMQRITLDVILRAVFGLDEGARLEALRARLVEGLTIATERPYLLLTWFQHDLGPLTAWRRLQRLSAEIDAIIYEELARRRTEGSTGRHDVLAMLLEARDEAGKPLTDPELRDELITVLVAGHETTATTMAWVLHRLLRHPEILARARAEVRAACGAGPVAPEDAARLEYLDATIKETQRLMPIIPLVGRSLRRDLRIGGHDVPAGYVAAPCIYLTHRRPDVWADPERFDPERFLGRRPSPYEFFPFGGGTRHCLGAAFASYEMRIVLAEILARVELRPVPGYEAAIVRRGITFAPSRGMPLYADRRAA